MATVFLCGQKDCGKTYFLRKLEKEQKVNVYDLDEEILKETGYTNVRSLYAFLGEDDFRKIEGIVFDKLVKSLKQDDAFIALGGGATELLSKANKIGKTVYLYQLPEVLYERMEKEGLPSFVKDRESFTLLFNERHNKYKNSCSITIDLFHTEEGKVCQTLLEQYLN